MNLVGCRMTAFGEYADDGTASTLKQRDYKDATDLIVQPNVTHALRGEGFDASEDGTGRGTPLVIAPETAIPLTASGQGVERVGESRGQDTLIAHCLTANYGKQIDSSNRNGGPPNLVMAMQINASDEVRVSDVGYTLNTNGNATGRNSPTVAGQFGVRRLTPRECERLQGFPDDWTRYGDDGKEISDSARCRMIGNAITCNVGKWIFKRIKEAS